jgi:hypothetical protein
MMKKRFAVISILIVSALSARSDWRFDAETGFFYNRNLSNSDRGPDEERDWSWKSDLRLGDAFQLTRDLRLDVTADLRGAVWHEYKAFDEIGPGLSAGLRYRFGLGRLAPWIMAEEEIHYASFGEDVRNGWNESLRLRGGIALTERIALEAGYSFDNFAARDNFFDIQGHRADTAVIFELTSALQVRLGYAYREGDVISYAVPPRPDILLLTTDRRPVDTFGTDPRYTAYRLLGRTHAISVSAQYGLTKHLTARVGYEYDNTWHGPLRYENHLLEASVAFAF